MRAVVDALARGAPGGEPHYLENSGWLLNLSPKELQALCVAYKARHAVVQAELVSFLGDPSRDSRTEPQWFESWYPEALLATLWHHDGKYICLAVEHADRETPVALALSCLTEDELAERMG